jgi:hypothetical protein
VSHPSNALRSNGRFGERRPIGSHIPREPASTSARACPAYKVFIWQNMTEYVTHQKATRYAFRTQPFLCRLARVFELCDRHSNVDPRVMLTACDDRVGNELPTRCARQPSHTASRHAHGPLPLRLCV